MSASAAARLARTVALVTGALLAAVLVGIATASPAAAHAVDGGNLPAPPWLLSYIGVFALAATAVALRATGPSARLTSFESDGVPDPVRVRPGNLVGVAALALILVAAIVGPDSGAANIAPVAVLVVWWVGLPLLCLVAGDVMRHVNPFVAIVALLDRRADRGAGREAPPWTAAAFLGAFAWFFVAYHRPGSPRAVAVLLIAYTAAAVLGGLRWGRTWLVHGEAFGALSAAVALVSPWRRRSSPPPGLAALAVVWIGSTAFDAFGSTPFWIDVVGTSQGWTLTMLNTVGLIWLTAVVAGVYLAALRIADRIARARSAEAPPVSLVEPLGVALVPVAVGWLLAHDLTLLLFEGQNFLALLSDPIGRGWDLFDTIDRTIDYSLVQATWVRWTQVGVFALGHVVGLVIAHDVALRLVRRRAAMRSTWAVASAEAVSMVAGALMVLG